MEFRSVSYLPGYEVSRCGVVRNSRTKYELGQRTTPTSNYLYAQVRIDNAQKHRSVHRMVATVWLDNPNELPQVNHKDGNKRNNCADNLEWCTAQYNTRHSRDTGLNTHRAMHYKDKFGVDHNRSLIVVAYPSKRVFFGLSEASRELGINVPTVHHRLKTGAVGRDGISFKYITPMIKEQR